MPASAAASASISMTEGACADARATAASTDAGPSRQSDEAKRVQRWKLIQEGAELSGWKSGYAAANPVSTHLEQDVSVASDAIQARRDHRYLAAGALAAGSNACSSS